jgi:hypothetical protein
MSTPRIFQAPLSPKHPEYITICVDGTQHYYNIHRRHSRCLRGPPTPRTKHHSSFLSRTLQWIRYQPRCPTRQYALAAVTNIWISNFGELSDFPLMMLFAVCLQDLVASRSTSLTSILRSFPSRSKEGLSYQYTVRFHINEAYQVHGEYVAFEGCSC